MVSEYWGAGVMTLFVVAVVVLIGSVVLDVIRNYRRKAR